MKIGKKIFKIKPTGFNRSKAIAILLVFVYKFMLEYSFCTYLAPSSLVEYELNFSIWKYINGVIWVVAIALAIDTGNHRVSSFMLFLQMMVGIIPITVVYALENSDAVFYNSICLWYFIACIFMKINIDKPVHKVKVIPHFNILILLMFVLCSVCITAYYFVHNGVPDNWVLGFSSVYEVRRTEIVIANKYVGYIADIVVGIGLPCLIAYSLLHKRQICALMFLAFYYIYYIYSGNKTMIFAIPLILIVYFFSRNGDCTIKIFSLFTAGITTIIVGLYSTGYAIFIWGYSLIIRRMMIFPADIKFSYYDYFISNAKTGLVGLPVLGSMFWDDFSGRGYTIGSIYYNSPEMNANTGFLVEGFERFGYIGFPIEMAVLVLLLKLLDSLQTRAGYLLTITMTVYFIFSLTDAQLIGQIISIRSGFMLIVIAMLFYDKDHWEIDKKNGIDPELQKHLH